MTRTAQYPRLLSAALGIFPTNTYRAVLYRIGGADGAPVYHELARCRHLHRSRHKAIECAELLARADGAPEL